MDELEILGDGALTSSSYFWHLFGGVIVLVYVHLTTLSHSSRPFNFGRSILLFKLEVITIFAHLARVHLSWIILYIIWLGQRGPMSRSSMAHYYLGVGLIFMHIDLCLTHLWRTPNYHWCIFPWDYYTRHNVIKIRLVIEPMDPKN